MSNNILIVVAIVLVLIAPNVSVIISELFKEDQE